MYHLKPDKRSQTSAAMLYTALMDCLRKKDFREISVTELVTKAEVGRSTFYRNFDEISDILYWKCDQRFSEMLHGYVNTEPTIEKPLGLLEYVFSYWINHSEVLETLISINHLEIIYDCFWKNSSIVEDKLNEQLLLPTAEYDYFISIRIGVFIGVFKNWIKNGKKENAQQLSQMLGKGFLLVADSGLIF